MAPLESLSSVSAALTCKHKVPTLANAILPIAVSEEEVFVLPLFSKTFALKSSLSFLNKGLRFGGSNPNSAKKKAWFLLLSVGVVNPVGIPPQEAIFLFDLSQKASQLLLDCSEIPFHFFFLHSFPHCRVSSLLILLISHFPPHWLAFSTEG